MKLTVILICIFLVLASSADEVSPEKLKVTVFFETRCSDSVKFFRKQLAPTYDVVAPYVSFDFYAFGVVSRNLQGTTLDLKCQHGPRECQGNMMVSCARKYMPEELYTPFTICVMSNPNPPENGPMCAQKVGYNNFNDIEICSKSPEGFFEFLRMGEIQNEMAQQFYWAPWIIFNNSFDDAILWAAQKDFLSTVCQYYSDPKPEFCQSG